MQPSSKPRSTDDSPLVLVVEDDPTTRFLYAECLERLGYRMTGEPDASRGLEAAIRLHPDVIIMDVAMPGMSGIEATRRLKADPRTRDCIVFVVTGGGSATLEAEARAAGCDAFFTKPFDPSVIADVLRVSTAKPKGALPEGVVVECTCGRELTHDQWLALPLCGRVHVRRRDAVFELRTCKCGSSLALECAASEASQAFFKPTPALEKIFVVDRDPHVRRLMLHFIGNAYVVEFFDDGYAALDQARKVPPFAIITEIMVPRLDGLALCRLLKADRATVDVPVLVVSVLAASERARESGANGFLDKPLEKERFVASFLNLTERRENRAP
jgi:two-component system response regulator MprA